MKERIIRIGSRESRLAVIQSELVAEYIRRQEGFRAELVTMKTTGDRILDRALDSFGGKGLFVKELDLALLEGRTDLSVHSLKDMPMEVPETLPILGFSRREDPRDVLVLPKGVTEWDREKPVGCASKRRVIQLQRLWPDVKPALIRGNVETRLRKLDEGQYGATILAAAGLKRLGLEDRISRCFTTEEMIPAAGQGILAVQGRADGAYTVLDGFFDREATACALSERAFVRALNGGCSSPTAAYAEVRNGMLHLTGMFAEPDGSRYWTGSLAGNPEEPEQLGLELAEHWRRECGDR